MRQIRSSTSINFSQQPSSIESMLNKHRNTSFIDNLIKNSDSNQSVVVRRMKTATENQTARAMPKTP